LEPEFVPIFGPPLPTSVIVMARDFARDWMWSQACEMLTRAEQIHREFFRPTASPAWEPPVDMLETSVEVLIFVALPGVPAEGVEATIEDGQLVIAGTRTLPNELQTATIHRLELPQGRFIRRINLPPGRYTNVRRAMVEGCLLIRLEKTERG
jgi:HSP20 family molecular chaperone IbpA